MGSYFEVYFILQITKNQNKAL